MLAHSFSRFGTIIALSISLNVHASTLGSEVALFTPWTFIQKKVTTAIAAKTVTDVEKFPGVDWQLNPWTPHLTNVQWNLTTKLVVENFSPQSIQLKSTQMAFTVTMQKIDIDQIIEQNVDGAIIRVHVQATCGPVTMTQPAAQMEARLGFQVQPTQVNTSLDLFTLSWAPNSWKVSAITCVGPTGFAQTVQAELTQTLQSAELVRPWLQGLIAQRAQSEANSLMTQLANPIPIPATKSPLPLVLSFHRMENIPEGILNYGILAWSGNANETNLSPLIMNGLPSAAAKSALPIFISPTDGWTNLIAVQLQHNAPTYSVDMSQIKTFKALLASPSQQAAVWPDLENYTTSSKFNILVNRPRGYSLAWQSDGTAAVASPVSAMIQSVRGGRQWDYIALSGSVLGSLNPQIASGNFNVNLKFSKSSFTGKFQPVYVQTYQANTTLDAQVLQGFSTYVNEGFKYSTVLPTLNVGVAGTATFSGWTGLAKDLISMPMTLAP